MTPEHIVFVPAVFALGLLTGLLLAARRRGGATVLITLLIALAIFALTHLTSFPFGPRAVHMAAPGVSLFDQSPAFSADDVASRLTAFGAAGRALYQRLTWTGDVLFPLSLLLFFLALSRYAGHHLSAPAAGARWLSGLPMAWFVADMAENAIIFVLLANWPQGLPVLATLLAPVTVTKFLLLFASIAVPLAALVLSRLRHANPVPPAG